MNRLFVLLLVVLSACSTSGPAAERDGTTRSRPISLTVPHDATANPLAPPQAVLLTARAVCPPGEGCSGFFLDFRNPGGSDLFLNYTPVSAEVDGEQFAWPEIVLNEQRMATARGTFLKLGVDAAKFRKIAFAQEVTFHLGTTAFRLEFDRRGPFRELLDGVQ